MDERDQRKPLRISQVANLAGVGVETVRFYERESLVNKPLRRESGYREYPTEAVDRIRFIRRAKDLGFTLKEIRELLDLRLDSEATCGDVRETAQEKIADIEGKIRILQRMKRALVKLTSACDGSGSVESCPILGALEKNGRPILGPEPPARKEVRHGREAKG